MKIRQRGCEGEEDRETTRKGEKVERYKWKSTEARRKELGLRPLGLPSCSAKNLYGMKEARDLEEETECWEAYRIRASETEHVNRRWS